MRERIDFKKIKLVTKIAMTVLAILVILIIGGIVKFFNVALKKEAQEKRREELHLIDKDIIKPL